MASKLPPGVANNTPVVVKVIEKTPGELAIEAAEELAKLTSAAKVTVTESLPQSILTKHYRVLVDGIVAGSEQNALGVNILKDLITRADIENSGADFEWLLKTNAIEEAGYR